MPPTILKSSLEFNWSSDSPYKVSSLQLLQQFAAIFVTQPYFQQMKMSDVSWRARVGGFNRATHLSISSTPRGMDSFLQGMVCALTLAILLMVAGVEMNPGPVSVSYISVNLQGASGCVRMRMRVTSSNTCTVNW